MGLGNRLDGSTDLDDPHMSQVKWRRGDGGSFRSDGGGKRTRRGKSHKRGVSESEEKQVK